MIVSPQHRLVYYAPGEAPPEAANAFPSAIQPDGAMVLPMQLDCLRVARVMGMQVPPILDYDYDWPIKRGWKPTLAQRTMASFMVLNPRSFNLSEMRTGKTLSALWAADYLMTRSPTPIKALVIAPLRTLERTWRHAVAEHFIGRRTCSVLHGVPKQRIGRLEQDVDFYLVNYDGLGIGFNRRGLTGFAAELAKRQDIGIVIIDESTAYKTAGTQRHRAATFLVGNRDVLWMMTGTPTPQGPVDAYGQARMMNNAGGYSLLGWRARTMTQITKFKWVPQPGSHEEVKKLLAPAVRFRQDECFDAPDCVVMREDAEMSAAQKKLFEEMRKRCTVEMQSAKVISAVNEGVMRAKLIQIACGALYDDNHESHYVDAAPRLGVLREVIEAAPRKIIVFAPLTSVVHLLEKFVSQFASCVVVNGEVGSREADERIKSFQQDPDIRVLIAHPGPIARGLDLTAAATIIWYAPTDRTEDYIQANERINGPAQTHKRTIVQISASAVEREIYRRLEANESLQGAMLTLVNGKG